MLEGGYCSDTNYERKYAQKLQQHQLLHHTLTQHGFEVRLLPLPLGFAGTMYKTNMSAVMELARNWNCL